MYVSQPEGFLKQNKEHMVCRLVKALYGLRQATRGWYAKLSRFLENLVFTKCPYEHAVYTRREGEESLVIGVYVDDLIITGTSLSNINKFKKQMGEEFEMNDLERLSYYLGIEVGQEKDYIELKQSVYAKKLLEKAGLTDCNPSKYPMETKVQLVKDESGKPVNPAIFKSLVGGLRYVIYTRPDIAYLVVPYCDAPERDQTHTTLHQGNTELRIDLLEGNMKLYTIRLF